MSTYRVRKRNKHKLNKMADSTIIIITAIQYVVLLSISSLFPHRELQGRGAERPSPPLPCRIRRAARLTPASTGLRSSDTNSCAGVFKKYVGSASPVPSTSSCRSMTKTHNTTTHTQTTTRHATCKYGVLTINTYSK